MTIKTKPIATTAPEAPLVKSPSKSALVLKLLGRAKGATIAEIEGPTGWQPHSSRAYLSGLRKKGRSVVREQRKAGETAYRIVDAANSAAGAAAMVLVADAPPASSGNPEASDSVSDVTDDDTRADVSASANVDAAAVTNLANT